MEPYADRWTTVRVEVDDGIAWVELNRPEKRNAMSPTLNAEMVEVLLELDADDDCGVLVLTGAGEAFSAGMDLKEYFREVDGGPEHVQRRVRRDAAYWQWRLLRTYAKPTIAMVNGWCFGGAFTPLVACDLAIAADEATFGLSEINWGIPPGSVVSKALADTVGSRAGLLYVMTGRTFDGQEAAAMGLVNSSVPRGAAARRGRDARAGAARQEPGRAARRQARLQALRRDELGPGRGLPLRQGRAVAVPRHGARPRAGPRAVPRREARSSRACRRTSGRHADMERARRLRGGGMRQGEAIWTPPPDWRRRFEMGRYMEWLRSERGLGFDSYDELWRWSVTDLEAFWVSIWEYFEVRSHARTSGCSDRARCRAQSGSRARR